MTNAATVAEKRPVCGWAVRQRSESSTGTRACSSIAGGAYEYKYAVCVSLPAFRLFLIELFRSGKVHRKQRVGRVAIIGALRGGLRFVTVGGGVHATILVRGKGGVTTNEWQIVIFFLPLFPLASGGRRYRSALLHVAPSP